MVIVLEVIFDAVVNVRDLGNVKIPVLSSEILLKLGPSALHQFPRFTMVQGQVWEVKDLY